MAVQFLANSNGWLSWNSSTPRLYVTAESDDFDEMTLQAWANEGFEVNYIPMNNGGKAYVSKLQRLGDGLSIGERYAIVAYGDAAAVALEAFVKPSSSVSKLCALVAYYPTEIPDPHVRFPAAFRVLVHLAGGDGTVGVNRNSEVLGIQGKRRTVTKRITPGIGAGGLQANMAYPCYTYEGVDAGFAEQDLDEYDKVADGVAWSRSLSMVRRAFQAEVELEKVWEENMEHRFHKPAPRKLLDTMTETPLDPCVLNVPTLTGGFGKEDLLRFYSDFFQNPPSMSLRLLSRTIGSDRIVDELLLSFTHTDLIPWILPGIPPTNKKVEIAVVMVVCLKAGRLYSEHVYWDQASVLAQVGLLDPEQAVSKEWRAKGVQRLPVSGKEQARKVVDEEGEEWNEMLGDW